MFSRLHPIDLSLFFEDRTYKPGETVHVTVELTPCMNVKVRDGRLEFICEESYERIYTFTRTQGNAMSTASGAGVSPLPSADVTEEGSQQRKESFVRSSVTFLSDARLLSGTSRKYHVELAIGDEPPRHTFDPTVTKASVKWTLVARLDVAKARNAIEREPVQVRWS